MPPGPEAADTAPRPAAAPEDLCRALATIDGFAHVTPDDLEPMPVKGLVHAHIRIRGRGLVLRVPRLSQFGFAPERNLAYQAACFERARPSGATPALRAVIPPQRGIAFGALVVEEIAGRAPRLPDDMAAIADCLAAIHALPLPPPASRLPLTVHDNPVAGILGFIETQAAYLPQAGLGADARAQIEDELAWARTFAAETADTPQPIALVGTDTHPGNYLVEDTGRAVFVDLEKALYGSPAVDLAHASVYTSTMWEPDSAAALAPSEVAAFYARYLDVIPAAAGAALRPWLAPMRRLTWLRTTTWCLRWRVEAAKPAGDSHGGAANSLWSADRLDSGMVARVRARIDDYFDPATIARIRAEWLGPDRLDLG